MPRARAFLSVWAFAAAFCLVSAAQTSVEQTHELPVRYQVSLRAASEHVVSVEMILGSGASVRELRMPVWNALYQVRDFAKNILRISASDSDGRPLSLRQVSTSLWTLGGAERGATVRYDIYADDPGPYGAQLNESHAFLNFAQVLLYEAGLPRNERLSVNIEGVKGWRFSWPERPFGDRVVGFLEGTYDQIVDTPVEAGAFRQISFQEGPTRYDVYIDADSADYDAAAIENSVRRVVRTELEWMKDAPCPVYTFIYHFPRTPGGGGMEHACSTAIDVPAERMKGEDMSSFEGVTAHEFFHLWNVKRIRPRSLEPIDYSREQETRALWFSEGVTSTVEDVILLRAGLITKDEYLRSVAYAIELLEQRPARKTQSVEESSLQAWFEKYPFYRRPDRSISYYNKGEILGVMLDLTVREATSGDKSLRDVLLWMNEHYAKQGRFFADSDGVREAVEAVSGRNLRTFFDDYVAGTAAIPYDTFLDVVGYRVEEQRVSVADLGFVTSRNFNAVYEVVSVQPRSEAEKAGVRSGDIIETVDKSQDVSDALDGLQPGATLQMRMRSGERSREVKLKVGSKEVTHFSIVEVDHPTPEQLKQRSLWLEEAPRSQTAGAMQR